MFNKHRQDVIGFGVESRVAVSGADDWCFGRVLTSWDLLLSGFTLVPWATVAVLLAIVRRQQRGLSRRKQRQFGVTEFLLTLLMTSVVVQWLLFLSVVSCGFHVRHSRRCSHGGVVDNIDDPHIDVVLI